jgi:hypothetical protein
MQIKTMTENLPLKHVSEFNDLNNDSSKLKIKSAFPNLIQSKNSKYGRELQAINVE